MSPQRIKNLTVTLLLALAIFCTGRLGMILPAFGSTITLIWMPTGIAVAVLFRWGLRCWPGLTLGGIAANLAIGIPWPVVLGIAVGNTLAPILAAWALRRMGFHPAFDRSRDILLLAVAAALGMLVSSSLGVTALSLGGIVREGRLAAWLTWWAGDAMGVILAAPLVFAFVSEERRMILRRSAEFLFWLGVTCVVTWGVFVFNHGPDGRPWALAFLPLPLLVWGTQRFGGAGTSLAVIVLAVGAAYGTATGRGPFFRANPMEGVIVLWIYMATSATLGWLITAVEVARVQATGVQRLFERALTDVSLGVLLAGLDRRITYANQGFTQLTGYPEAEILGKSCTLLQGPETDPATLAKLRAAVRGGGFFDGEILNYRKDGTTFWNGLLISPVRDERGAMTGYLAIQRDVTRSQQAEQALATTTDLIERTGKMAKVGGWELDLRTMQLSWSRETCRIHEVEPPVAPALDAAINFYAPEARPIIRAAVQAGIEHGRPWDFELPVITAKGRSIWARAQGVGVMEDGKVVRLVGAFQDITERHQAQIEREQFDRKLQETQKLESLGVLAGGIAHDFNNLLTAILGNASIAQIELPPGSSAQDCLENINEASLRAADLCKQMLAYSGRGRFVVQTLDLGQLLEQTAQMLHISISKKAVLRYRLEKGLPNVEVDATQLRQVIMNLVINASEAIGDTSGVISISTGLTRVDRDYLRGTLMDPDLPAGDYVFLEVSDSGCGMSAETQARIFDPFFTTKFTGRGLGLAAVLGIVRGHQGALKVYSEVGRGTTFKLLFPAAAGARENAHATAVVVPAWRGEGTVLVVDDEETMRSTVARMMRLLGLDPVLAADGREAVEIFRTQPGRFALVLLDLTMPHMDGEQTFGELRRLHPDVRVVLMSGFNAQEALVRFPGKGLANFLQKPFTVDALRAVLRGVLEGKTPATK